MDNGGRGRDSGNQDTEEKIVCDRVERAMTFFDTWSVIIPDESIKTKVFRKETHMKQYMYLNFSSNHPLEHKKREVACTLLH